MSEKLLLDEFLPAYDHEISVSRVFRAPPEEVFDAVTNLDLFQLPLARVLLEARALPGRLVDARARRRGQPPAAAPPTFRIRDLPARGWILLGERPGVELVCGQVGKPWKGAGGVPDHPVIAHNFAAFAEPGFAKLAESTLVMPYGASACVLTAESRVALTDEDSRRRFRRYWLAARAVHPSDAPGGYACARSAVPGTLTMSSRLLLDHGGRCSQVRWIVRPAKGGCHPRGGRRGAAR